MGSFLAALPAPPLPLETVEWSVDVVGPYAEVTIRERFRNVGPTPVDALYVFPLSEGAAVDGLWLRVETRELRGEIRARDDARRLYEAARDAGGVAALTESAHADVFTQDVANLPPGAAVDVELRLVQPVERSGGVWTLPLPLATPPGFTAIGDGGSAGARPLPVSRDTGVRARLEVNVHAATGVRWLEVAPYPTVRPDTLGSRAGAVLEELPLDRDVVVRWRTERDVPQGSLLVSDTHALILLEGAAPGTGHALSGLAADVSGCPMTGLTDAPAWLPEGALFQAVGLRVGPCRGPVVVDGFDGPRPLHWELWPRPVPRPRALASAWARRRVALARSPEEVLALGLRWGIVTSQTSFVAIDPGTAGVKAERLRPMSGEGESEVRDGWQDEDGEPEPELLGADLDLNGGYFGALEDAPTARPDRGPARPTMVARRRPPEKTPLTLGGLVLTSAGAALCAVGERGTGPGLEPACVGGIGVGVLGLSLTTWGVLLEGR